MYGLFHIAQHTREDCVSGISAGTTRVRIIFCARAQADVFRESASSTLSVK